MTYGRTKLSVDSRLFYEMTQPDLVCGSGTLPGAISGSGTGPMSS